MPAGSRVAVYGASSIRDRQGKFSDIFADRFQGVILRAGGWVFFHRPCIAGNRVSRRAPRGRSVAVAGRLVASPVWQRWGGESARAVRTPARCLADWSDVWGP
jgi:hypothetical protein